MFYYFVKHDFSLFHHKKWDLFIICLLYSKKIKIINIAKIIIKIKKIKVTEIYIYGLISYKINSKIGLHKTFNSFLISSLFKTSKHC